MPLNTPSDRFVQEFADLRYHVLRRSLKEQVLGTERRLAKQHAVFCVGLSVTVVTLPIQVQCAM